MALRQGGVCDLGVVEADITVDGPLIKQRSLYDSPSRWDKDAVTAFLTTQLWTSVSVTQRLRGRNRSDGPTWVFQASPPKSSEPRDFWYFMDAEGDFRDFHIAICSSACDLGWGLQKRWVDPRPKTQPRKEVRRVVQVGPIQLDTPSESDETDTAASKDRAHSPRRKDMTTIDDAEGALIASGSPLSD